jgi:prophage regulatory protein
MNNFLRLPAVCNATGMARPTVYLAIKRGLFPPPVKLSIRASAWPELEVRQWQAARIAGKSDAEIRVLVASLEAQRTETAKHFSGLVA